MKTQNLKNSLKVLTIVAIMVMSFGITKGQSASDDAVLPLSNLTDEGVAMEFIDEVNNNTLEIKEWLNINLDEAIKKEQLPSCKFSTTVLLEVDKNGKISHYSLKNANCEVGWILEDVLHNAPQFEPVSMNGYPSRMHYEIPVTVEIR